MCDPVTLAVVSMGTTLASTGLGIAGQAQQAQQAQSQQAMYGYQAQVARNNQITADRLATDATERGRVEEDRQRLRTRALLGTQTAILAGQGTDLAGSPTDILGDTAAAGETDALAIRSNAAREAWGHRTNGVEFGNEASRSFNRQASSVTSVLDVGASLIAGGGAVADKWYRFPQQSSAS